MDAKILVLYSLIIIMSLVVAALSNGFMAVLGALVAYVAFLVLQVHFRDYCSKITGQDEDDNNDDSEDNGSNIRFPPV